MPLLASLTGPDALTEVLRSVRLEGKVFCRLELRGPWAFTSPPADLAHFHFIERGSCWIRLNGHEPLALTGGDLVVLPHPHTYDLSDRPAARAVPLAELLGRQPGGPYAVVRHGGTGPQTDMICGSFGVPRAFEHPLLSMLPAVIHLKNDRALSFDWLEMTLRFLAFEARHPRAGSETVMTHLIELIFIQAVRGWIDSQPEGAAGWLGALRDRQISAALGLIHGQPGRAWTVPALAAEVRMSRSAFAARFTQLVGQAPLTYLIQRRIWLAADLLRTQSLSLGEVAERVGYDSEAAFSRTFKKHVGIAPGRYRRDGTSSRRRAAAASLRARAAPPDDRRGSRRTPASAPSPRRNSGPH